VGHRSDHATHEGGLDLATATSIAATLQALATPSRLMILSSLQRGPNSVGELAQEVGMQQSAVSHQLRLLRNLGLVAGERDGRHIRYHLYDDHVSELLDQAMHHAEHVRLGVGTRSSDARRD
jgi:DNA-binding transcriptional ArsR family regulator